MDSMEWLARIQAELQQADASRVLGNEGRARVCARRAAGAAVGEYLARNGLPSPGPSAYDRLQSLCARSETPPRVREIASHFLVRITPEHTLPINADLVAEARWLVKELLGIQIP